MILFSCCRVSVNLGATDLSWETMALGPRGGESEEPVEQPPKIEDARASLFRVRCLKTCASPCFVWHHRPELDA